MGWQVPQRKLSDNSLSSCTISVFAKGSVRIILRHDPGADPLPSWLRRGSHVKLLVGDGDQTGMIRFVPADGHDVYRWPINVSPRGRALMITIIGGWIGSPNSRVQRTVCDYDYQDDWFEVSLPQSWYPKPLQYEKATTAVHTVAAPLGGQAPFKMLTTLARNGDLVDHG